MTMSPWVKRAKANDLPAQAYAGNAAHERARAHHEACVPCWREFLTDEPQVDHVWCSCDACSPPVTLTYCGGSVHFG